MKGTIPTVLLALLSGSSPSSAGPVQRRQETVTQTVTASGAPSTPTQWTWNAGGSQAWPIHESCNATERALLKKGLEDAAALAAHARDHVLRFGNGSAMYQKYFGAAASAEVVGWYDKIANGDRSRFKIRCDDVDGNCALPGWGGHWRGENATDETVICPLSYTTRKPLEGLCGYGYTVARSPLSFYFGADLVHRLLHMPSVGEGAAEHFADSYAECLELARAAPAEAVRNSHSLQYFALDVYAFDVAVPGEGCTGKAGKGEEEGKKEDGHGGHPAPTATTSGAPSTTSSAAAECHTHADGEVHCA
ncbi:Major allergen Asp f 2 [Apiospora phragmitis]|uniref:Major allergen Asp f 2 n=1 Tax=Apiospora phragmitis TaxID=2905665 RepID=A0ABR1WW16_9PEZI